MGGFLRWASNSSWTSASRLQMESTKNMGVNREHCKVWGNYAAILSFPPDFILGYHCSNLDRSVPSRVRARV